VAAAEASAGWRLAAWLIDTAIIVKESVASAAAQKASIGGESI